MAETLDGFDWDAGNRAKCQKHGVSLDEIEALFSGPLLIVPDTGHSRIETRIRALGETSAGRMIFLVFTVRRKAGLRLIRPISARYMHAKEVASYEKENPEL
jgi:uncharacterized DUF497 family protein